jgi:hypothetical protein
MKKPNHEKVRLVLVLVKIARELFELAVKLIEYWNSADKYGLASPPAAPSQT